MFSCEYCKFSSNNCFEEHLRTAASENDKKKDFFEKPPANDHYLIDMDGQRPKIYSTWPLIGPYLQRCTQTIHRQIA